MFKRRIILQIACFVTLHEVSEVESGCACVLKISFMFKDVVP